MSAPTPVQPPRRGDAATPIDHGRPRGSAGQSLHTPQTAGRRTPGTGQRLLQLSAARTPHARAALLALDHRRATKFTPGRQSRRKSGRYLRESPRDLLRNLSRRLAPMSQPMASSSSPAFSASGSSPDQMDMDRSARRRRRTVDALYEDEDDEEIDRRASTRLSLTGRYDDLDDDDSLPLDRPRMSLPIGDGYDDDDDDLQPHRSLILDDDENLTLRSIELARRTANHEQLQQARRFSRSSLGSLRMSDYMDGFIGSADGDDDQDGRLRAAFFPDGAFDNLAMEQLQEEDEEQEPNDTFERLDSDSAHQNVAGRESGFGGMDVPMDGNETTFLLAPPGQDTGPVSFEADESVDVEGAAEADARDAGGQDSGDNDGHQDGHQDGSPMFDDYDYGNEDGGGWPESPESPNEPAMDEAGDVERVHAALAGGQPSEAIEASLSAALAAAAKKSAQPERATGRLTTQQKEEARAKRTRLSRHGIPYPSLPVGVVKRIAQTMAQGTAGGKAKLSADTVAALSRASDWFFEQVSVDLERYCKHAGRKTIDESDVLLLMRRQRQVNAVATPFSLAQRFMPRELLQELRMVPDTPAKGRPNRRQSRISVGDKGKAGT